MSGRILYNLGIAATIAGGSAITIKYLCDHNEKEKMNRGEWGHVREAKPAEYRGHK